MRFKKNSECKLSRESVQHWAGQGMGGSKKMRNKKNSIELFATKG